MDIVRIFFDNNCNLNFSFNWVIIFVILIIVIVIIFLKRKYLFNKHQYEFDEAEIGIGSQKFKIKPNYQDMQIAYKLWVEVSTRKIGLDIDFRNDIIIEIYNSWYEFFKITRELIKDIPVSKVRKFESTQRIVSISIDLLNMGLRPHLTSWQAKFRKWYDNELTKNVNMDKTPQEIQNGYPLYNDLIEEMEKVNSKLIKYRSMLKNIYTVSKK